MLKSCSIREKKKGKKMKLFKILGRIKDYIIDPIYDLTGTIIKKTLFSLWGLPIGTIIIAVGGEANVTTGISGLGITFVSFFSICFYIFDPRNNFCDLHGLYSGIFYDCKPRLPSSDIPDNPRNRNLAAEFSKKAFVNTLLKHSGKQNSSIINLHLLFLYHRYNMHYKYKYKKKNHSFLLDTNPAFINQSFLESILCAYSEKERKQIIEERFRWENSDLLYDIRCFINNYLYYCVNRYMNIFETLARPKLVREPNAIDLSDYHFISFVYDFYEHRKHDQIVESELTECIPYFPRRIIHQYTYAYNEPMTWQQREEEIQETMEKRDRFEL